MSLLLSSYRVLTVSIEPFRMRCSYWLGRYVGMCPGAYSDPAKETDGLPHSGRFADKLDGGALIEGYPVSLTGGCEPVW